MSFVVDHAHRMPANKPPQGALPQVFIAKFLNHKDQDAILRLSREKGNIPLHNHQNMAFPDFSVEVQLQCSQFTVVNRRLRVHHLKYAMQCSLLAFGVVGEDWVHFFDKPKAACDWLDRLHPA